METYIYEIISAKGILTEQLNQELLMIVREYNSIDYPTQTQLTIYTNSIILTTTNYKLIDALIKDKDFITKEIKQD